jgi:hypothetical protein
MRSKLVCFGGAAALALSAASVDASAQDKAAKASERDVIVSVVGCVELEADYRKRIADGKGGTLGSGAGAANEFVLTFARSVSTKGVHTEETHAPVGTSGLEEVYSITGRLEDELKREVGRQVEVTGYVEVDESAGTPKVKDLARMHINQWTRLEDFCPNPKR